MQADPYAPPQSSVAAATIAELKDRENGVLRYSTFWHRVAAYFIDFLCMSPIIGANYFMGAISALSQIYLLVAGQLAGFVLYVYMVRKFGGTPGKLLLGMRIAMLDGSPVTLKATWLRYSVGWLLSLVIAYATAVATFAIPADKLASLGFTERSVAIAAAAPAWYTTSMVGKRSAQPPMI